MSAFFKGIAVVELDAPATFTNLALNLMRALLLAIASSVNFSFATPVPKYR
jgi:hypothetical protein